MLWKTLIHASILLAASAEALQGEAQGGLSSTAHMPSPASHKSCNSIVLLLA
jgi:hypothetical protein